MEIQLPDSSDLATLLLLERTSAGRLVHDQGLKLTIAVNVSGRQFSEANLFQQFDRILSEVGANASWIELEITEGALIDTLDTIISKLNAFADNGFGLAIDDFGTGYSSLSYLKRFPISKLKIDRSFIVGIQDNSDDKAIAHAIIAMGNSLKMQVIAEGIETEQQAQCLLDFGCHLGQGFLVSRSVAPERISALCNYENLIPAASKAPRRMQLA
jgi:EAL domain-containing protein (putative c-di-GMP-specific phosphodiesterase class I)